MKRKITKKIVHILLRVLLVFFALDLFLVLLVFAPPVQKLIIGAVENKIESVTSTPISIKSIYIDPLFRLHAKEVNIMDHHKEKMIYIGALKGKLYRISSSFSQFHFNNVVAKDSKVVIRRYLGEEKVNIALWASHLKSDKEESSFLLHFDDAELVNGCFQLILDDRRRAILSDTIDYGFFELKNINCLLSEFKASKREVSLNILQLNLEQYTGFKIENFTCKFKINRQELAISECNLKTEKSKGTLNFGFHYNDYSDYSDFMDKIHFDVDLHNTFIHMDDIACFAPAIKGMHNLIQISGKGDGPLNALKISNCRAKYGLMSYINGDITLFNISDPINILYDIQLNPSQINLEELAQFYLPGGKTIGLPKQITQIGNSTISGNYHGTLNFFKADLSLKSTIGNSLLTLSSEPNLGKMKISGKVSTQDLSLQDLIPHHLIGTIKGDIAITGNADPWIGSSKPWLPTANIDIDGYFEEIEFCKYPTENIALKGEIKNQQYEMQLSADDPNLSFVFDGTVDLRNKIPQYKTEFHLDNFEMSTVFKNYSIHPDSEVWFHRMIRFVQNKTDFSVSFSNLEAEIAGNNIENLTGFLAINQFNVKDAEHEATCDWFRLTSVKIPEQQTLLILKSALLNATLSTNYKLNELADSIEVLFAYYLPSLFPEIDYLESSSLTTTSPHFFNLNIETFETGPFLRIFFPHLRIAQNSELNLNLGSDPTQDRISLVSRRITLNRRIHLENIAIHGNYDEGGFAIQATSDTLTYIQDKNKIQVKNVSINSSQQKDLMNYYISWINADTLSQNQTSFINGSANISNKEHLFLKFTEANLFLQNVKWNLEKESDLFLSKDRIDVNHLLLSSTSGNINIDGSYSKKEEERLFIHIDQFDVSQLNSFTGLINLNLEGKMSALFTYLSGNETPRFYGKSYFDNLHLNNEQLGTLFMFAEAPQHSSPIFFGALFLPDSNHALRNIEHYNLFNYQKDKIKLADLNGSYDLSKHELKIKGDIDTVRIGFLSPFLSSFSHHVSGTASGDLLFVANPDSLYFDGNILIKEGYIGISPLNTIYKVQNQNIGFNSNGIILNHITILDQYNNRALLNGKINHHNFKHFSLDLAVETERILAMSRIKKVDSYFYGDAFASGKVTISGDEKKLMFRGEQLKTLSGTMMGFPISYASTSFNDSGIRFVSTHEKEKKSELAEEKSNIELDFDFVFDVNRDADVRLDLDPVDGILECKTNGLIRLTYNNKTNPLNMDGSLDLLSGEFSMSIKNLLPRKFELMEGGKISFNGPIKSSTIALTALYSRVASLKTLNENINIPRTTVNSYLSLSGNLMNPQPSFSFGFPKLTGEEAKEVFTYLDTTDHQNNFLQFFSLTYLGTFYSSSENIGDMVNFESSINLLSSTIGNMLLQEIKGVDIGVNLRTESGDFREYSFDAAIPLYKDRIMLKTNLGYAESLNDEATNSNFSGEGSVEYRINKEGNWLIKLFYFNDQTNLNTFQSVHKPTQGGGVALIYQQEFYRRKGLREYLLDQNKKQINQLYEK
ncbi:MAG TPA: translocation/assembly module TamB domain-containing protein [Bacteroidales bacterium]|nr:translocation/assembly module TamB domain-containing protein [Bacteroidales bacterium]